MIFLKNQRYQHIFHGPNMIPHIFFSKVIRNRFFIGIYLANHLYLLSIQMPSICLLNSGGGGEERCTLVVIV